MADTSWIRKVLEPHIRGWLSTQFMGRSFNEKLMNLAGGGRQRFDAVSDDDSVVVAILSNRAKTRTGKENTGGVHKALEELERLSRVRGSQKKVAVFTDSGFCDLMKRRTSSRMGNGIAGIEIVTCELPLKLQLELAKVLDAASAEQRARGD